MAHSECKWRREFAYMSLSTRQLVRAITTARATRRSGPCQNLPRLHVAIILRFSPWNREHCRHLSVPALTRTSTTLQSCNRSHYQQTETRNVITQLGSGFLLLHGLSTQHSRQCCSAPVVAPPRPLNLVTGCREPHAPITRKQIPRRAAEPAARCRRS